MEPINAFVYVDRPISTWPVHCVIVITSWVLEELRPTKEDGKHVLLPTCSTPCFLFLSCIIQQQHVVVESIYRLTNANGHGPMDWCMMHTYTAPVDNCHNWRDFGHNQARQIGLRQLVHRPEVRRYQVRINAPYVQCSCRWRGPCVRSFDRIRHCGKSIERRSMTQRQWTPHKRHTGNIALPCPALPCPALPCPCPLP